MANQDQTRNGVSRYIIRDYLADAVRVAVPPNGRVRDEDLVVYRSVLPEGWDIEFLARNEESTSALRIIMPENRWGERRSIMMKHGDWLVVHVGSRMVTRWPSGLFRLVFDSYEESRDPEAADSFNR